MRRAIVTIVAGAAIGAALALAFPANAQRLESHRLGGTTYYRGKAADGAPVTGTSRKLGNTTYSEFRSSGQQTRCTTRTLGSRTYTECR